MHNLVSFNQLLAWKKLRPTIDKFIDEHEVMNDYFNCIIECDDNHHICKKICKEILSS